MAGEPPLAVDVNSCSSDSTSSTPASSAARTGRGQLGHDVLLLAGHHGLRRAGDDQRPRQRAAERAGEAEHLDGVHPVRVDRRLDVVELRLDHARACPAAARRRRVEQHDRVVAVAERVGEVHAADPVVDHLDAGRQRARGEPLGERDAEAVVAEEDVADAGDEDPPRRDRLDLLGREEEAVRELRGDAEVAARIVGDRHDEVHGALHVLLDRLDDGEPAREHEVEHVGAGARAQPHPAAAAQLDARDGDRLGRGPLQLLPAHRAIPNSRIAPCSRISSLLRQRLGALEDLPRARVGVAHLGLLGVGQAEDVEHQHLVDLAAVEQVARALGRDPRMVLEDDRRGRAPCGRSSTSTGQAPSLRHAAAAARSRAGGSVWETKRPPLARRTACVEQNVRRSAVLAVRRRSHGVVFAISTPTRRTPSATGSARTSTLPSSASHERTIAPPAQRLLLAARPRSRPARGPGPRRVSSRSTASSQERWRSPPATSSSTGSPSRSTWRATTCRKRTATVKRAPSPSSRHSVRIVQRVVGMALGVRPRVDAAERPAALVLGRRAAVGPQQVALVEHRVGDRADGVHVTALRPAARRRVSSQLASAWRAL